MHGRLPARQRESHSAAVRRAVPRETLIVRVLQLDALSVEFASMLLFIACILTELFLYCYSGNELTVEV